jgi:NCS1 family nucleobase:cation symporter-1
MVRIHLGARLNLISAVQIIEYWLIRRGHYRVSDLYHTERTGWYWYTFGINPRAYGASPSFGTLEVLTFITDQLHTSPVS